jgi:hypothetical protein
MNGNQFSACYNQDLMPAASGAIDVALSSGAYYVVMCSSTYMQAKNVTAQIDLTYYQS